ncbi:hypothetical protein DSO57_1023600 [Entomophthora muscae]|uniref:Uncharacterized protein n=1 Tax=Entomophthora muscae TaxID=34485 RepID=A0ACC2SSC5_9FUNG|nr:hypothetical protein DSO57_1023600 [Entomophthora muscae]
MEASQTLKPDRLYPTPGLTPPTANKYEDIAYITLSGLFDTMVPAAGPWALVGQSASYLIKLAPLLWWALPFSQQSKLAAKANSLPLGHSILTAPPNVPFMDANIGSFLWKLRLEYSCFPMSRI